MRSPGRHSVGDNLVVAVTNAGSRSWIARVRDPAGKRRDIGLGPFADLTLAEAREKARTLRKAGRDGQPILTKAEKRRLLRVAPSFKEAAERVHAERKGGWKSGKHVDQWIGTLEVHAYPKLGAMTVDAITKGHVIDALAPIWNETPETARRVRQRIGAVLDWAWHRDLMRAPVDMKAVATVLGAQREVKEHFAAMPYAMVPAQLAALVSNETIGNLALRFLILTAARSGEVRGCAWSEIDERKAEWTIPAERMKAKRPHVVPLPPEALAIVARAKEIASHKQLIFPGLRGQPMSDATMGKCLRVANVHDQPVTVHGMRSAFRDWVSEETTFPGDVAEAALAHIVRDKVEAAYRRGNLLAKRRELMNAWARYCAGGSADVVRMVAA